jgi:hypothetical protein
LPSSGQNAKPKSLPVSTLPNHTPAVYQAPQASNMIPH